MLVNSPPAKAENWGCLFQTFLSGAAYCCVKYAAVPSAYFSILTRTVFPEPHNPLGVVQTPTGGFGIGVCCADAGAAAVNVMAATAKPMIFDVNVNMTTYSLFCLVRNHHGGHFPAAVLPASSDCPVHVNVNADLVEFSFTSDEVLLRTLNSLRLLDFAEAFLRCELHIHGDIKRAAEIIDVINATTDRKQTFSEKIKLWLYLTTKALLPGLATRFEAAGHYGRSPTVYEIMLDSHMQYTCGYFRNGLVL
jgi:hypothetical protein